jgi:cation:H+ antiporter
MLLDALFFACGLVLLLLGGRFLVNASVDTATRLRISPLVVGLTLVAWGTSAPELALNIVSALKGRGELALGNVVGANICNMALVLGVSALIKPLVVEQRLLRIEVWLNAALLAGLGATAWFLSHHSTTDASGPQPMPMWLPASLLVIFTIYSVWTIYGAMRASKVAGAACDVDAADAKPPMSWLLIVLSFVGGLVLLSVGGSLASDGASGAATKLGVPAAIVGVTIVSIGTTLPELVTSVLAVRRGRTDLAMGNAIGSCIFNAGAILGLVGLLAPAPVPQALQPALLFMGALAIALIIISRTFGQRVARIEGVLLVLSYLGFLAYAALTMSRVQVGG